MVHQEALCQQRVILMRFTVGYDTTITVFSTELADSGSVINNDTTYEVLHSKYFNCEVLCYQQLCCRFIVRHVVETALM